jgi:ubiquinone/menaquinone biosynthesis C-methylase UbiE
LISEESYVVFDRFYERYDYWYLRNYNIYRSERDCIKTLTPHGKVLDIGVGTGFLTSKLTNMMVGVDPAEKPLILASKRGFLTVNSFAEDLPFINNYFDTVLVIVTLCFVKDPLIILRESYRVLRSNGSLITCIVPRESIWAKHYLWLKHSGKSIFYKYARFLSIREVIYMLINTGFEVRDYCSTLFYEPYKPPHYDMPVRGLFPNAGFVCIRAVKND